MAWDQLYNAERGFIDKLNRWLTQKDRLDAGYSMEVKRFRELDLDDPIMTMLRTY